MQDAKRVSQEAPPAASSPVPDFDTPIKSGHFGCEINVPLNLPATWAKPRAYIIGAVENKFGDNAAYLHWVSYPTSVLFITSDAALSEEIQSFSASLVEKMAHTTSTFRLRLRNVSPLNNEQIKVLLAALGGEVLRVEFTGQHACEHYGHTAFVDLRHSRDWKLKDEHLPFRSRGQDCTALIQTLPKPGVDRLSRPEHKERQAPCRDFQRGFCLRDVCRFAHDKAASAPGLALMKPRR